MRRLTSTLTLAGCLALSGCGVTPQAEPVPFEAAAPTRTQAAEAPEGPRAVTVYFIREDRLQPAARAASDTSARGALELLGAGPAPEEVRTGVRTAIAPASIRSATEEPDIVVIDVNRDFVETSGTDQLLAVAQVVWTVTERNETRRVRLTNDGTPVEVPTDDGLSADTVDRDDYDSVAPEVVDGD